MNDYTHLRRNRKFKIASSRFNELIANPAIGSFVMPVWHRLAIKNLNPITSTTLALSYGTQTFSLKDMNQNSITFVENIEADQIVTIQPGFQVFVDSGLGVLKKIAEG